MKGLRRTTALSRTVGKVSYLVWACRSCDQSDFSVYDHDDFNLVKTDLLDQFQLVGDKDTCMQVFPPVIDDDILDGSDIISCQFSLYRQLHKHHSHFFDEHEGHFSISS